MCFGNVVLVHNPPPDICGCTQIKSHQKEKLGCQNERDHARSCTWTLTALGITGTLELRLTSSKRLSLQCLGQTVQHDCYIHDTGRNQYRLYNTKTILPHFEGRIHLDNTYDTKAQHIIHFILDFLSQPFEFKVLFLWLESKVRLFQASLQLRNSCFSIQKSSSLPHFSQHKSAQAGPALNERTNVHKCTSETHVALNKSARDQPVKPSCQRLFLSIKGGGSCSRGTVNASRGQWNEMRPEEIEGRLLPNVLCSRWNVQRTRRTPGAGSSWQWLVASSWGPWSSATWYHLTSLCVALGWSTCH